MTIPRRLPFYTMDVALELLGRELFASHSSRVVSVSLCRLAETSATLRAGSEQYELWKQLCRERFEGSAAFSVVASQEQPAHATLHPKLWKAVYKTIVIGLRRRQWTQTSLKEERSFKAVAGPSLWLQRLIWQQPPPP